MAITITPLPPYQVTTRYFPLSLGPQETWRHPLQIDWDAPTSSFFVDLLRFWDPFLPAPRQLDFIFTGSQTGILELFEVTMDSFGHGFIHLRIDEAAGDANANWKNPPFHCDLRNRAVYFRFRTDTETIEKPIFLSVAGPADHPEFKITV